MEWVSPIKHRSQIVENTVELKGEEGTDSRTESVVGKQQVRTSRQLQRFQLVNYAETAGLNFFVPAKNPCNQFVFHMQVTRRFRRGKTKTASISGEEPPSISACSSKEELADMDGKTCCATPHRSVP